MKKRYWIGGLVLVGVLFNAVLEEHRLPRGVDVEARLTTLDDYNCEYKFYSHVRTVVIGVEKRDCKTFANELRNELLKSPDVTGLISINRRTVYDGRLHNNG